MLNNLSSTYLAVQCYKSINIAQDSFVKYPVLHAKLWDSSCQHWDNYTITGDIPFCVPPNPSPKQLSCCSFITFICKCVYCILELWLIIAYSRHISLGKLKIWIWLVWQLVSTNWHWAEINSVCTHQFNIYFCCLNYSMRNHWTWYSVLDWSSEYLNNAPHEFFTALTIIESKQHWTSHCYCLSIVGQCLLLTVFEM